MLPRTIQGFGPDYWVSSVLRTRESESKVEPFRQAGYVGLVVKWSRTDVCSCWMMVSISDETPVLFSDSPVDLSTLTGSLTATHGGESATGDEVFLHFYDLDAIPEDFEPKTIEDRALVSFVAHPLVGAESVVPFPTEWPSGFTTESGLVLALVSQGHSGSATVE